MLIKTKFWLGATVILIILVVLAILNIIMHKRILTSLDARDEVRTALENTEGYTNWRYDINTFVSKMLAADSVPAKPRNLLSPPVTQDTTAAHNLINSVQTLIELVDQKHKSDTQNEKRFEELRHNIIVLYKRLDRKLATLLAQIQLREVLGEDVSDESSLAPYVLKSLNQLTLIALNSLVTRNYTEEDRKNVHFNRRFLDAQLDIIDPDGSIDVLFKKLFVQINSINKLIDESQSTRKQYDARIQAAHRLYNKNYILSSREHLLDNAQSRVQKADHNLQLISSRTVLLTSVFLIFVPLLIIGSGLIGVRRLIFLPLHNLSSAIEQFEKGDMDAEVAIRSDDEIGHLSAAFNKMAEEIRQKVKDLDSLNRVLTESEETYRLLTENSQAIIFTLDKKLCFTYVSPSVNRFRGSDPSKYIGRKITDTVPEEETDSVMEAVTLIQKRIHSGSAKNEYCKRLILQLPGKNKKLYFEVTLSVLYNSGKKAIGILGVARDVTERIKAEEQLKSSLSEKEILLREILHRTKNNMGVISSFLQLQAASHECNEVKRLVRDSTARIRTMALAHEMLYKETNISCINMQDYITGLVDLLKKSNELHVSNVSVHCDVAKASMMIDAAIPCGLIINELLTNCYKYAFPDGRKGNIYVQFQNKPNNYVELTVRDDGIGLPPDFDPDKSKSLGIQIIKVLAESQLKGELYYHTDQGVAWHISFKKDIYKERGLTTGT